eukprot:COSAG06_NODE_5038_length_3769_cov_3.467847_3_plen_150_part_01
MVVRRCDLSRWWLCLHPGEQRNTSKQASKQASEREKRDRASSASTVAPLYLQRLLHVLTRLACVCTCVLQGSHKSLYPLPRDERTSIDLPCVVVPALNAGDVLFFGGPTHGATAWRADPARETEDRRAVIFFYQSKEMSLGPGNIVEGAQ